MYIIYIYMCILWISYRHNNKPWVPVDSASNGSIDLLCSPQDRFLQNLVRLCVNTSCTALLRRQRLLEKLDAGHGKLEAAWLSQLLAVLVVSHCYRCRNQKMFVGTSRILKRYVWMEFWLTSNIHEVDI